MSRQIVNADNVIGVDVKNREGDSLGKIEALMLDKYQGQVAYVVLSFGGFLGMGDKLFAMPWSIFSYDPAQDCFVISVDKETLKKSPGFDKDHWPDMSNPSWMTAIHKHYGTMPSRSQH
ncbi:PRC-barrel domain protein [Legionella quinlivanii]|uniref:PRC-barrel domain protein n=1 Tax=Legionella quinlivanii TaxID=45073 RepID=A0A0W0Y528_9GAMM|nr:MULTISPECIES: PRC-barrel domain-containing protein [Legionella]KTD52124.1 PRC-barrel domain protein [Legionella quinlivanii]MCE3045076.1 PRC-barrel domain-containing protein [Legionella sp. 16cNR16C]MCW8452389.1 PRC-barrel domain-containing protein [Legionella quinlivanii]RAP36804.1 photosystem reaction center subunit H [Legionella quinlivanii]SEF77932.1 PRC-barrel domain-containing protein [Legionella quinlivanii DSM 21216]